MLATRVLRNAYTRRMMAELARKGELLGPRPKVDPSKKPRQVETIKMAPPTDNAREASLFFHRNSIMMTRAPLSPPLHVEADLSTEKVEKVDTKEEASTLQNIAFRQSMERSSKPLAQRQREVAKGQTIQRPSVINQEWLAGIGERTSPEFPIVDLHKFITKGLQQGFKLTPRHRKTVFLSLHKRGEFKAVVELSKKLNCDDLRMPEFEAILHSASHTNQWRYADHIMNKHWDLVEKGPKSVSFSALKVFINIDFSVARAFVDQLMHDKRFKGHKNFQAKVAELYLEGTRSVALNLSEMMRFANQYQHLDFMESEEVLAQMARGIHQLGTAAQAKIYHQYLCSKGFDKLQSVKEVMFLRYLYQRNFDKALRFITSQHYYSYKALVSGYRALANRQDWEGVLTFHKMVKKSCPDVKIHDIMNCSLIEAYGATYSMGRAIAQAQTRRLTRGAVLSLFRVFCHHYPEQAGDLERLLASPQVAEIRLLTNHLDLRNMVPMMLLNSMDVRQGVAIAAFQGVHIERRRTIEAMVRQGHPERAYKYYTILAKTEIPFSEHDYLTLIRGLCKKGFLQLAEEVLADYEKAVPHASWRRRVCKLDVDMLRSRDAGIEGSRPPRVILKEYIQKYCSEKAPRRDGPVLGSPKYKTKTGYEWISVAMHMVSQGLFVEARDFLKSSKLREPMVYALLAECYARLGDISEIEKLIKEMKTHRVRTDQTYKALSNLTEYHYGTGLVNVLNKLKVSVDERYRQAVRDQKLFLETLVSGVRKHEEEYEKKVKKLHL